VFAPLDILEMDIIIDTFCSIDTDKKEAATLENVIKIIEEVITGGPYWQLNPTCKIFVKKDTFSFQKEILIADVAKNSSATIEELDIHRNVAQIIYPVKLMILNARSLSDEIISKSKRHIVHTILGKVTL